MLHWKLRGKSMLKKKSLAKLIEIMETLDLCSIWRKRHISSNPCFLTCSKKTGLLFIFFENQVKQEKVCGKLINLCWMMNTLASWKRSDIRVEKHSWSAWCIQSLKWDNFQLLFLKIYQNLWMWIENLSLDWSRLS